MKKSYILGGAVILILLFIGLLIVKMAWRDNPEKANTDLGAAAKADSFAPSNMPTISVDEKIIGNFKAPIKILVYEDYSDIFSADNAEVLKKVETEFGNQVVIIVRPFALREKPAGIESAMAVECAFEQGKWQEMRTNIFAAVKTNSLSSELIKSSAIQIGLDETEFNNCLTDTEKQGIMLRVTSDAKQFSVYGTPTTFVNNELIVGARPYEDYLDEFDKKVEGFKSLVTRQIEK